MMPQMKSSAPAMDMPDEEEPEENDEDMGARMLALQNILSGIKDIASEDMKPHIEEMMQNAHMSHEMAEGDQMGMDQEKEHEMMSGKPGVDVTVAMGKPKMDEEEPEEDENSPKKGGFLAILAKRMKNK